MLPMDVPNLPGISLYFPWVRFPPFSISVRYATLALSCVLDSSNERHATYLAGFYGSAMNAIDSELIEEVFVSAYVALLYSFRANDPLETLLVYFEGMRSAFSELTQKTSGLSDNPTLYWNIHALMRGSFRTLLMAYMIHTRFATGDREFRQEVDSLLLLTTNVSCPYSRSNLVAVRMNGPAECGGREFFPSLLLPLRMEYDLRSESPPSIEASFREIVKWYNKWWVLENYRVWRS